MHGLWCHERAQSVDLSAGLVNTLAWPPHQASTQQRPSAHVPVCALPLCSVRPTGQPWHSPTRACRIRASAFLAVSAATRSLSRCLTNDWAASTRSCEVSCVVWMVFLYGGDGFMAVALVSSDMKCTWHERGPLDVALQLDHMGLPAPTAPFPPFASTTPRHATPCHTSVAASLGTATIAAAPPSHTHPTLTPSHLDHILHVTPHIAQLRVLGGLHLCVVRVRVIRVVLVRL